MDAEPESRFVSELELAIAADREQKLNAVKQQKIAATTIRGRSRVAAFLFAWFLPFGMLGVHQFYIGNSGWGWAFLVTTLLFCWCPPVLCVIAFLCFVEGIAFLCSTDPIFD